MPDGSPTINFPYEILTPQGRIDAGQTVSAMLPAIDGAIGFLAHRAPVVAQLGAGRLSVRRAEGGWMEYFVSGGFAHVRQGALTVLAEECTPAESLNRQAAEAELALARDLPAGTEADWQRRQRAVTIAKARLRVIGERPTG